MSCISRKFLAFIASLSMMATVAVAVPVAVDQGEPFGRIQVDKVIVMPDAAGHSDWVEAIQNARTSIHMEMYHLTDRTVMDALAAKAQTHGIDLRVIIDGKLSGGYKKAYDSLIAAGIQVRPSIPLSRSRTPKRWWSTGKKLSLPPST